MSRLVDLRFLRLIPLAALLFSARAFAQFEVAPDHFDSKPKGQAAPSASAKSKTRAALPAKAPAATKSARTTQAATVRLKQSTGSRISHAGHRSQRNGSADVNRTAAKLQETPRNRD